MRTTLISTGGTIAWHREYARMLTGSELLETAGEAVDEVVDLVAVASWDLSVDDMAVVAARVRAAIEAGAGLVLVAHGTDTMEETAWLTELMLGAELRGRAAVLFTGAMRFAGDPGSDGPTNLQFALQAGRDPSLVGAGVHVAWPGTLHPARSVRKVDAAAPQPFESSRPTFRFRDFARTRPGNRPQGRVAKGRPALSAGVAQQRGRPGPGRDGRGPRPEPVPRHGREPCRQGRAGGPGQPVPGRRP